MIIRKTFPRVFKFKNKTTEQTYFIVDCRSKKWGMTKRLSFTNERAALDKANDIEDEIMKFGGNTHIEKDVITNSDSYVELVNRLKPFDKTPQEAVEHYLAYLGQQTIMAAIPRIEVLITEFEKYKLLDKTLSPKSVIELRQYCKFINDTWSHLKPCELSRNDVEMVLRGLDVSNNTRRKYLTYIKMFIKWVYHNKEYLTKNVIEGINFKREKFQKEFYTNNQVADFLRKVDKEYPQLLGYYVLSTFVGLRPSEAERVEWKHINFDTMELHVNAGEKGKTGERHIKLTDTLIAWLGYIKFQYNPTDLIPLKNLENVVRECHAFMETWIQDGLRHTFATNYNSLIKNFYETAHYMGNSVAMVKQHYAKTVPQAQLKEYWALVPINVFKVD